MSNCFTDKHMYCLNSSFFTFFISVFGNREIVLSLVSVACGGVQCCVTVKFTCFAADVLFLSLYLRRRTSYTCMPFVELLLKIFLFKVSRNRARFALLNMAVDICTSSIHAKCTPTQKPNLAVGVAMILIFRSGICNEDH